MKNHALQSTPFRNTCVEQPHEQGSRCKPCPGEYRPCLRESATADRIGIETHPHEILRHDAEAVSEIYQYEAGRSRKDDEDRECQGQIDVQVTQPAYTFVQPE